ncbi:MAG: efflux RND transporter periplasmic adaptor subunit [Bacteroidetes bacterium]|nr:efflux RND transporter periplasmic adaptor subunit [Bacteroidota bacterium]
MKKIFLIAIVGMFALSCNTDKKTKLENLKKQHDEIAEQIKTLEKEVALETGKSLDKITEVKVVELKNEEFNHYIEVQGKIDGEENVSVSPKMMGVVTSINVVEGQEVKKGQILAQLDDAILKQSLNSLDSTYTYVNNLYLKQKKLWDQKIGSEVQYLTAKNTKESIENNIKTLKEQVLTAKIVSPINGTVEEIPIKVGQAVTPGVTTAFRVVNLSKVKVLAEIAEAYSAKLKTGNNVKIFFPDLDKEVSSKISFASKYINAVNRTFTVEVRLDNTDDSYRANMIAVVKINDYHADSAITIPVNVIQKIGGDDYVYVAEKNNANKYIAKKVKVEIGRTYNGFAEILKGLKKEEKCIINGYQNLEDGQLLKF